MANAKWRLEGYDTFSSESYAISGEYDSEGEARDAARRELASLETQQPTASSGGQREGGIQDRVFVVRPDGTQYRFVETPALQ